MKKREKKVESFDLSEIQADTLNEGSMIAAKLNEQLNAQHGVNDKFMALILDANNLNIADIEEGSIRFLADEKKISFSMKEIKEEN